MATASSILANGMAMVAGQGSNGKGSKGLAAGLVATAALGLSLLVGGVIGLGRPAAPAAEQNANPFAADAHVATVWDFREDRRVGATVEFAADQFTYREDRRVQAIPQFVADQFTYREDRRVEPAPVPTISAFVPDQFTYREDRRVELVPILMPSDYVPNFWIYREDRRDR